MVNEMSFIVRISGRKESSYYVDYLGAYKVDEIAKIAGLKAAVIEKKYLNNGAQYDKEMGVYYFNSIESAKKAISDILGDLRSEQKGRFVQLTEAEIEYIRRALINEESNNIHVGKSIKDQIFRKLNS